MNCPNCGNEHPENAGRFCDHCGLSVIKAVRPAASAAPVEEDAEPLVDESGKIKCPACGVRSPPPLCLACYVRLPSIDD